MSGNWEDLAEEEKTAWNGYADTHPRNDPLGIEYYCTGHQLYVGYNTRLRDAGDTAIDLPPVSGVPNIVTALVVTQTDVHNISIAFGNTLAAGERLVAWMSLPQSGSGNPNFAQARMIGYSAKAGTTPLTLALPFGVPEGYTVNYWVAIQGAEGLVSVVQKDRVTAEYA